MMHQVTRPFTGNGVMPESVSVHISNYNHARFIQQLVYRLVNCQSELPQNYEIILTDGGSHVSDIELLKSLLEEYSDVKMTLVLLDKSKERAENSNFNSYSFCINAGAQVSTGDVFIHCDSSILVPDDFVQQMASPHTVDEKIVLRAGLVNYNEEETRQAFEEQVYQKDWKSIVGIIQRKLKFSLGRPAWSVRREAFFEVGGMDQEMVVYSEIDDDFITRLIMRGYSNMHIDSFVIHQYHQENRNNHGGVNHRKMLEHIRKRQWRVNEGKEIGQYDRLFRNFEV